MRHVLYRGILAAAVPGPPRDVVRRAAAIAVSCMLHVGHSCADAIMYAVVRNNPAAFSEAYWEVDALRVYTPGLGDINKGNAESAMKIASRHRRGRSFF